MIEKISGSSNVMQNISNVPEDARAKMEFKDELTDEFDDMKDELVKDEFDSEGISIKSPIGKDAFDIVDEFISDNEGPVKINGAEQNSEFGLTEDEEDGHEVDNGDLNPLDTGESCDDQSDIVEEICDDGEDVDPLMNESENNTAFDLKPGKRKNFDGSDENMSVRKSSRLRSKAESREEPEPEKPKEKQKMLQRPTERPTQVEEGDDENDNSDSEAAEEVTDGIKEDEEQLGDPSRPPGADMVGLIDGDFLLPFSQGWVRECVYREMKSGPPVLDTVYYHPPKTQEDLGPKNREARRKRKNKHDQEKYFEDFPSNILSVINFSYVKRELGLNNEAYEKITAMDGGPDKVREGEVRRSARKVASYKEVAEHEGLLESEHSSAESSDEAVEEVTDFDFGLPLTLQLQSRVTPLREEHRRKRKYPDRKRCVTPPRASDIPWTQMDDDPLGLWTELHEECLREREKAPPTPPPIRAMRLYQPRTVERLGEKLTKVKEGLADPLQRIVAANKDLVGSENLCSHDLAIRKYKHLPSVSHRNQMRPGMMGAKKAPPQMFNRNSGSVPGSGGSRPGQLGASQGFVKVRLPMQSTNGKRPVVELVMLTNGKYQPIKFTNNRQVTEAIPKRLFDQANSLRKTLYQRSVQVPKIGTKQVFLAINPTPGGVTPYTTTPQSQQTQQSKPSRAPPAMKPSQSEQVSILVRPSGGGNPVLLNVPRNVALKVKTGTTLSFSASTDQKYTVIDNKLHPPVGKHKPAQPASQSSQSSQPARTQNQNKNRLPHLPSGVSIRPVTPGSRQSPVTAGRPVAKAKPPGAAAPPPQPPPPDLSTFTPCSPFCPGVSGIPELECTQCHSLFHPKCVSIPQWKVATIQNSFKCKRCSGNLNKRAEVIDID